MWKVLLAIAAVVLCGAAYLGFENKKSLERLYGDRVKKEKEVVALKVDLANTIAERKKEEEATMVLVQETEGINIKITVAQGKESEYKGQIVVLNNQVQVADTMLKKGQKFMREVPDIEARRKQMAELQNSIQEEITATTNLQAQIVQIDDQRDKLQGQANELQALTNDQAAGIIRGPFKSTVRQAFNNWGFVIIGAGDEQGVVNRAQLAVTRRGQPICKLMVTSLEPGECVAEIIPGSMAPGQAIQQGDEVSKTTRRAAAPAGGGIKPPTPALPSGDMKLPPDGGLLPGAPAGGADMKLPPAGDSNPFGLKPDPAAPKPDAGAPKPDAGAPKPDAGAPKPDAAAPKKPDVDSDPFKIN